MPVVIGHSIVVVAVLAGLAGCGGQPRPILYPNAHLSAVGQAQADEDLADCRRLAETAGASAGSGRGEGAARDAAVGGAIGGATGAAGGAVLGRPGTGAAVGAATGATANFMRSFVPTGPAELGLSQFRTLPDRTRLRAGRLGVKARPSALLSPRTAAVLNARCASGPPAEARLRDRDAKAPCADTSTPGTDPD